MQRWLQIIIQKVSVTDYDSTRSSWYAMFGKNHGYILLQKQDVFSKIALTPTLMSSEITVQQNLFIK